MHAVMKCDDPKDLWETLCQLLERKTVSNKLYALMQMYDLRKKRGASIQDHLHQILQH